MAANEELRRLCEADQADRRGYQLAPGAVERDRARRRRVAELIEAGALREGLDYHHAALIFQHGETLEDYWRAYELARAAMDAGVPTDLAATAYDRWLMAQGKPQKFGKQVRAVGGRWELWPVDPATTDAERAAWTVAPLAELRRWAEELNRTGPPPPRSQSPVNDPERQRATTGRHRGVQLAPARHAACRGGSPRPPGHRRRISPAASHPSISGIWTSMRTTS
jgi:hypothetical protein